jgi:hypothetical protein
LKALHKGLCCLPPFPRGDQGGIPVPGAKRHTEKNLSFPLPGGNPEKIGSGSTREQRLIAEINIDDLIVIKTDNAIICQWVF